MEARSQAVAIIHRAEKDLRDLLLRVAGEGDYQHVALLAEWAQRLRKITEQECPARRATTMEGGIHDHAESNSCSRGAGLSEWENCAAGRHQKRIRTNSNAKKADYPKFFRDRDELVKIGWSKKQKAEYRHKAPWEVVLTVARALQEKGSIGEKFNFDELLPIRTTSGLEVPSYQAYLVLAWLRKENLILQHGRRGYTVGTDQDLVNQTQKHWSRLSRDQ